MLYLNFFLFYFIGKTLKHFLMGRRIQKELRKNTLIRTRRSGTDQVKRVADNMTKITPQSDCVELWPLGG